MINNVVPTPKSVQHLGGTTECELKIISREPTFSEYTDTLKAAFKKLFKVTLTDGEGGIVLAKDDTLPRQSYRYDTSDGIVLSAHDQEGILYAIATLILTACVKDGKITVSRALINDYPEREFRALMVDLAERGTPRTPCFSTSIYALSLR